MTVLGAGNGTSYPSSLDTAGTEVDSPAAGKTKVRAAVPNDLYAAVVAIETALGTNPILTKWKFGGATHDVSATGTQAITGVGFTPARVIIVGAMGTTGGVSGAASLAVQDTAGGAVVTPIMYFDSGVSTWIANVVSTGNVLFMKKNTVQASAYVSSYDADWFTLTWANANSPTGTCTFWYIAIK